MADNNNSRTNQSANHSDRDDVYPQDERPYRQNDFMGDSYYRSPNQATSARTAEDAREYFQNNSTRNENSGRHYARPRTSGAQTLERGRYMDRDSSQGMSNRDERDVYRSDVHEYDRSAGSSRGRSHLSGSDYGGQDRAARGPAYDRYGSWDSSSRAVDADLNLGSAYGTSTSFNAGPIYGEPSGYNDGLNMGAYSSTNGVTGSRSTYQTSSQGRTQGQTGQMGQTQNRQGGMGQQTNSWGGRESFAGRGPKNYKRSDERIREEVSEALFHHHDIDASEIEIEVKEGMVTLRGEVDDRMTKRAAEDAIEHLSGVKDIRNELTVNKGFFAKAKDMLMGESDVEGGRTEQKPTQTKSKH